MDVVMDTNVAVVANGAAEQAGPDCVDACIEALAYVRKARRVVLAACGRTAFVQP